jgi:type VI secretion system secreted protein Hcp
MNIIGKRLRGLAVFCLLGAGVPGIVGADIYMDVDHGAIRGEATEPGHRDWIVLQSFAHGLQNIGCPGIGGKGSAQFTDFVFTKSTDIASTLLYRDLNVGATYGLVEVHLMRDVGGQNRVYQKYEFTNARFQVASAAGADGQSLPMESWSMNYASVTIKYTPYDAKGIAGPEQSTTLNVSTCP